MRYVDLINSLYHRGWDFRNLRHNISPRNAPRINCLCKVQQMKQSMCNAVRVTVFLQLSNGGFLIGDSVTLCWWKQWDYAVEIIKAAAFYQGLTVAAKAASWYPAAVERLKYSITTSAEFSSTFSEMRCNTIQRRSSWKMFFYENGAC